MATVASSLRHTVRATCQVVAVHATGHDDCRASKDSQPYDRGACQCKLDSDSAAVTVQPSRLRAMSPTAYCPRRTLTCQPGCQCPR
eukprot:297371-Hanusia_phi.AAC.1